MIAILLLLQATPQAPANTPRPAHDAVGYNLRMTIPDSGKEIRAEVSISWRLLSTNPIRVELDTALHVDKVTLDNRPVTNWLREGEIILIPHRGSAGDQALTSISYHGVPWDGLVIKDSLGVRTIFSDNWPNRAHRWFPSQDYPSDKANVEFHVTASNGYQVIANGDLAGQTPVGTDHTTWFYQMLKPIPVYTMVIGVAKLAHTRMGDGGCEVRCIPVDVLTYPQDSSYAVSGPFKRTPQMVDYFTSIIGEFPYTRLSHVQSSTIFGGMENSTVIFYDEDAYRRRAVNEGTVAHETAHQWFGDAITEREWSHLWLSEGFATYFAALWAEHLGGDSALQASMKGAAQGIFRSEATSRPIIDSADNLLDLLNTNNYNKGSWVLHSLRGIVGDSAFFKGIRDYYARYRDSTVLSEDFQRIMEAAAGTDLAWYFHQALNQPGFPRLEVGSRFDSTKKALEIRIRQNQQESWGVYSLPGFELLIDGLLVRVDVEGRESTFSFDQFTGPAKSIEVDPNGWWLHEASVKGER